MNSTKLIFAGGFLGAGKTTLLSEATRILTEQGKRVGLITNDQAADLVDTKILNTGTVNIAEVTGSCFCCDFKALRKAIDNVGLNLQADVIIAEPVGSCTDLSATLINPIKDKMKTEVTVTPLTVLADPKRLKELLSPKGSDLHPSAAYIIRKQLEESDIIAITKTDLYPEVEIKSLKEQLSKSFPECEIITLSSKTGEGVKEWLDSVLSRTDSGKHIVNLDYDRYAEGEAVLGWLNSTVSLSGSAIDWDGFIKDFMTSISTELDRRNKTVGHVKTIIENGNKYIAANLTGGFDTLNFRWSAGSGDSAEMVVNARVEMSPADLENLFRDILMRTTEGSISAKINRLECISPGYPNPTFRYTGD
jgi:G3E family GTPase